MGRSIPDDVYLNDRREVGVALQANEAAAVLALIRAVETLNGPMPEASALARNGDEAAARVLGHSSSTVTHQHYADQQQVGAEEHRVALQVLAGGRR